MSRRLAPTRINELAQVLNKYFETRGAGRSVRFYDRLKPALDLAVCLPLFIVTLPMVIGAWLMVKLSSRGPGIYSQVRTGRHGRPFRIYKLRTMFHNCEALSGVRWSQQGDPRVTPIGRVLRRSHIDEIPQLWNVIRGDMSLIGPRPERPEFVGPLDRAIPGYRGRLAVKPGVTGLAQIQLPADSDFESVRRKLTLDLCYVDCRSASLDIRILIGTILYLLGVPSASLARLMALPSRRLIEMHPDIQPALANVSARGQCEPLLES
jgi:lipopolysaccharide/colanic/teichoic acid biosynthesis glycosyltransferase